MVPLQLKDPLEPCKEKGISSQFQFSNLSQYDLSRGDRSQDQTLPSFMGALYSVPQCLKTYTVLDRLAILLFFSFARFYNISSKTYCKCQDQIELFPLLNEVFKCF